VSFESVNYPGFFLRHQDFRLKLIKNDNSRLFKDDASFFKRTALAGGVTTASFEASKFPGFYIRHRDFHLWLEKNDPPSDLFKKDATFIIGQGLAAAPTSAPQQAPEPEATRPATAPLNAQPKQAPESEAAEPATAPPNAELEQAPEPQATTKAAVGQPPPTTAGGRSAKVIADVPVYAAPGGKGEPVGMLRAGTTVSVLGACSQSWCHVRGDDVPGGQGWVYDGANYNSLQY
jgi:hypothetical protein